MPHTGSPFPEILVGAPKTEGIKYAGSKLKLLPNVLQLANRVPFKIIFDGFSGSTRVSQAFARLGYQVIANDVATWSKVFATCYLKNTQDRQYYKNIIEHLNNLPPKDGWFTENYGGDALNPFSSSLDGLKKPWQIHNTRKLDSIRDEIDRLALPEAETCVLLTSLILALDQVDSTLGHFASYLNQWSPRSYKTMHLRIPMLFKSAAEHRVFQEDIFTLLPCIEADLAYYDPPYGSNNEKMPPSRVRYAAYYHLWTTVCLNDKPELFGRANRRADTSDTIASSVFEEFRRNETGRFMAVEAIDRLLAQTQSRFIILSYSSGGRATAEELNGVLQKNGTIIEVIKTNYKRNVMAEMKWTNEWLRDSEKTNQEFLFLLEK